MDHDTMPMHGSMDGGHDMSMNMLQSMFMVNGKTYDMQRMDLTSKQGEVEEWEVFNNSHMDHPFHLHGTQLVITKRVLNGQETSEAFKALRDTFNLKPYKHITFKV